MTAGEAEKLREADTDYVDQIHSHHQMDRSSYAKWPSPSQAIWWLNAKSMNKVSTVRSHGKSSDTSHDKAGGGGQGLILHQF